MEGDGTGGAAPSPERLEERIEALDERVENGFTQLNERLDRIQRQQLGETQDTVDDQGERLTRLETQYGMAARFGAVAGAAVSLLISASIAVLNAFL